MSEFGLQWRSPVLVSLGVNSSRIAGGTDTSNVEGEGSEDPYAPS